MITHQISSRKSGIPPAIKQWAGKNDYTDKPQNNNAIFVITNITRKTQLADRARLANTLWSRMRGLLGRSSFDVGEALIIQPADSIHTFFMRFPIDLIFLDDQDKVLKIKENLVPFGLCLAPRGAAKVIELPANTIQNTSTRVGDLLKISP